ncbi:DUF948 domain-containing protein [Pseudarthrobacter oxydans]|uniref:DUF948 domain-containing protein n=1 Tax=Pseudarthrobacter oxydans TaxID=1671 RepID=UPI0034215B56
MSWPPSGSFAGRQWALSWPPTGSFSWPLTLDEVRIAIRSLSEGTTPLMAEVTATVSTTHQQLKKVDDIASNVSDASANLSALSSLVAASIGSPLIRVLAFSHGVRTALANHSKPVTGRRSR